MADKVKDLVADFILLRHDITGIHLEESLSKDVALFVIKMTAGMGMSEVIVDFSNFNAKRIIEDVAKDPHPIICQKCMSNFLFNAISTASIAIKIYKNEELIEFIKNSLEAVTHDAT